jgi:dTDP-4-amino-4,6-dideoxygalactose transaminase
MNAERQRLADIYLDELDGLNEIILPVTAPDCTHVYHIFNIRTKQRDRLQKWLYENNIATAIHYPVPVHLQPAYKFLGYKTGSYPIAEVLANTSLSLPLFPGLQSCEQEKIIYTIKKFFLRL